MNDVVHNICNDGGDSFRFCCDRTFHNNIFLHRYKILIMTRSHLPWALSVTQK